MRTAIYARVSTRDGRQEIQNQLRQLRRFCETQDWPVVDEYLDQASGKSAGRDQFKRLFLDASQRRFDALETLLRLRRLSDYGVKYRASPSRSWIRRTASSPRSDAAAGDARPAGAGAAFRADQGGAGKAPGPTASRGE